MSLKNSKPSKISRKSKGTKTKKPIKPKINKKKSFSSKNAKLTKSKNSKEQIPVDKKDTKADKNAKKQKNGKKLQKKGKKDPKKGKKGRKNTKSDKNKDLTVKKSPEELKQEKLEKELEISKYKVSEKVLKEANSIQQINFDKLSKKERQKLAKKVLEKIKGNIFKLSIKPVTARSVELCIKHSAKEERLQIFTELKPDFTELSRDRYGKFSAISLIKHSVKDKDIVTLLSECLRKIGKELIVHRYGNVVFDTFYRNCTPRNRFSVLLDLSYPKALLPSEKAKKTTNFKELLEIESESKEIVLNSLSHIVEVIVSKEIVTTVISHDILYQYLLNCTTSTRKELLGRMLSFPLMFAESKVGCKLSVLVFTFSDRRQKKNYIKQLKDVVAEMIKDDNGWMVVSRVLQLTDDTVLTRKRISSAIIKELSTETNELIHKKSIKKLFLHILNPLGNRFTSLEERKTLFSIPKTILEQKPGEKRKLSSNKNDFSMEELSGISTLSKKSSEVRRNEVLTTIFPHLSSAVLMNFDKLVDCPFGRELILETTIEEIIRNETQKKEFLGQKLAEYSLKNTENSKSTHFSGMFARILDEIRSKSTIKKIQIYSKAENDKKALELAKSGTEKIIKIFLSEFNLVFGAKKEKLSDGSDKSDFYLEEWIETKSIFSLLAVLKGSKDCEGRKDAVEKITALKSKLEKSDKKGVKLLLEAIKEE